MDIWPKPPYPAVKGKQKEKGKGGGSLRILAHTWQPDDESSYHVKTISTLSL